MKTRMYSVYDSKTGLYSLPKFIRTDGDAIRGFESVCKDESTEFNKYAEDYTLFYIGTYDDETGNIEDNMIRKSMGTALQFKSK